MKSLILSFFLLVIFIGKLNCETRKPLSEWKNIVDNARNKTVKIHAWGGSKNINNYLKWVKSKVYKKYKITLKHVKLKDTSDAVKKVLFEKISKKNTNGSVDIIWLNGENFSTMKSNDLLLEKDWMFILVKQNL